MYADADSYFFTLDEIKNTVKKDGFRGKIEEEIH